MNILALDLGTTTGWAFDQSGMFFSGSQPFKPDRFSGGGMRFLMFSKWLDNFLGVELVLFEEVRRHMSTDAAHAYGGYYATLTSWCEARKIPYKGIPVQTIKIHATGKGNSKKDLMIKAACDLGHKPKDDNEADAIHLLNYGRKHFNEASNNSGLRPASHGQPERPVQVAALPVARRGAGSRARRVAHPPR